MFFSNNLEKYEIDNSLVDYDYEISSEICDNITAEGHQRLLVFSSIERKTIKSALAINNNHYRIYLLADAFPDMAEAEYIYMGVAFLEIALKEKMLPLHASTILFNGEAIAFSAPSKTGKSTHTSLWETYINGSEKLNDDKTILTFGTETINAHGIPFSGSAKRNINLSAELKAIVFLKQAKENNIWEMNKSEAAKYLVKNIYRPTLKDQWKTVLENIEKIIDIVPIYLLEANMEKDAVLTVYNMLFEKKIRKFDQ